MCSAIGTIAAVWTAIFISTGDLRRRNDEAYFYARLTATKWLLPLAQTNHWLGTVIFLTKEYSEKRPTEGIHKTLENALEQARIGIETSELMSLLPLPNHAADRLASAIGSTTAATRLLKDLSTAFKDADMVVANHALTRISGLAYDASLQIELVIAECRRVATIVEK